jgi:hypothetical protein
MDMSEVILNSVKESKNSCNTINQVVELFVALEKFGLRPSMGVGS